MTPDLTINDTTETLAWPDVELATTGDVMHLAGRYPRLVVGRRVELDEMPGTVRCIDGLYAIIKMDEGGLIARLPMWRTGCWAPRTDAPFNLSLWVSGEYPDFDDSKITRPVIDYEGCDPIIDELLEKAEAEPDAQLQWLHDAEDGEVQQMYAAAIQVAVPGPLFDLDPDR